MRSPAGSVSHGPSDSFAGETRSSSGSSAMFPQGDPSSHLLGLPKSYPRLKRWVVVAFVVGAFAAVVLLGLFSM
jgi:hypothetical protein